jgi:hypothetical protein
MHSSKEIMSKICTPTSNPKNQPYASRPPGTLRSGNRKSWQQSVSSKSPLVKRARFFSEEYKKIWSAVTRGSLAPAWRGTGKSSEISLLVQLYSKTIIHRQGIYGAFAFFPSSCWPVLTFPYFSNNFCCHCQVTNRY